MSTIDTSMWNPDANLNTEIEGIPLNSNASIAQTWQALRVLMAAVKGDGDAIKAMIDVMQGATASADGASGLVPAPEAGDQDKFLKGDGGWGVPADTTYSDITGATASAAGTHGLAPAPAAGKQAKVLRGDGTWGDACRGCMVRQSGSTTTNPWYKFASIKTNGASRDREIVFLVEKTFTSACYGLLRALVRFGSNGITNSGLIYFNWLANNGFGTQDFVAVIPSNDSTTVELWCKNNTAYQAIRFTVLSEGTHYDNSTVWTLYSANSAGQASAPTAGTQKESGDSPYAAALASLDQRITALGG